MKLTHRFQVLSLLIGIVCFIAGCKSATTKTGEGTANIDTEPKEITDVISDPPADIPGSMGSVESKRFPLGDAIYGDWKPVYFGYDSASIRQEDRATLEEIAKWSKDNTDKKLIVAGHCDERGTQEYNRTLGQRRALAAREYLIKLGVPADRVGTVSYGEDKPAEPGQSEEAWSKNRRDEFGRTK